MKEQQEREDAKLLGDVAGKLSKTGVMNEQGQ